jgi:polyketide biosynthesis enoyl-CoA hydratase PksI
VKATIEEFNGGKSPDELYQAYGRVSWAIDEREIATVFMHDIEGQNVFSHAFVEDFLKVLNAVEEVMPRVVILRGLQSTFSGGADKESLMELASGKIVVRDLVISERLVNCRFPIIAAMEGHAMGGGFVIGLCSDIIVAAREARYGTVFMNMGFTPGMGTTTLLQGAVGSYIANEMMFTGKRYKGRELAEKGTNINYILPRAEVLDKARDIALQIAEKNPKSVQLLKYSLAAPKKKLLIDARLQEDMMHALSFGYPETKKIIDDLYAR